MRTAMGQNGQFWVSCFDPKLPILTHCSSHRWRPLVAKDMKQIKSGMMSRQLLLFTAFNFDHPLKNYGKIMVLSRFILKSTKGTQLGQMGQKYSIVS